MSLPGYDSWLQPPDPPEATDDPGTQCLGTYPAGPGTDPWDCEDRGTCPMCNGVVCSEHDEDTATCDGAIVHNNCHNQGCTSRECYESNRDDYLLNEAGL